MKNLNQNSSSSSDLKKQLLSKRTLILAQFFLIIFVYHILKDLKDTLVVTGSAAGAQVIPFIKMWIVLPFAFLVSYIFSKLYTKFGREKTFYLFVISLLSLYTIFAFCLYPNADKLYLNRIALYLDLILPIGSHGFIDMVCYWFYSLFYLGAELWSMMILSVLFWSHINEITSFEESKTFYPSCFITGNIAGIISGQTSGYLCSALADYVSWTTILQCMIVLISVCGIIIMGITRGLAQHDAITQEPKVSTGSISFKESCLSIFKSPSILCIAILVVGFGLTSSLLDITLKGCIKQVYALPQDYNAYVNQLTSLIGCLAVTVSLSSKWIFKTFSWSRIALATPVMLFLVSFIYFTFHLVPEETVRTISNFMNLSNIQMLVIIGSTYYVIATAAKYTIFDMTKEIAFVSIPIESRTRAKSIIDSVGSRLGKSGASGLYQILLITLGTGTGLISFIGFVSILFTALSIVATKKLGALLSNHERVKI